MYPTRRDKEASSIEKGDKLIVSTAACGVCWSEMFPSAPSALSAGVCHVHHSRCHSQNQEQFFMW